MQLIACKEKEETLYRFFVAGHTYNPPSVNNKGLHAPFQRKFEFLNQYPKMSFGILTGDIVPWSKEKYWDAVDADLEKIGHPVHFAVGNHDVQDTALYWKRYGETWYRFEVDRGKHLSGFARKKDLHIVLDPNLDGWNISGKQLSFLKRELAKADQYNAIFLYFHQILWWQPTGIYKDFKPNSVEGRAAEINFWTEIEPLISRIKNEVFCFAGDAGQLHCENEIMYHQDDNIHYIASGMGRWKRDNFIIVEGFSSGRVNLKLIALNGKDMGILGDVGDYEIVKPEIE